MFQEDTFLPSSDTKISLTIQPCFKFCLCLLPSSGLLASIVFGGKGINAWDKINACTMSRSRDSLTMPTAPRFYRSMRLPTVPFGLAAFITC